MQLIRMPEVFSGENPFADLQNYIVKKTIKRLFIVTGPHVSKTDGFKTIMDQLKCEFAVFDRTKADPSILLVTEMVEEARAFGADGVLGVGGGSPLDAAKVVACLLGDNADRTVAELIGIDLVPARSTPLMLVPTSAGTGSEVTQYAILTNTETQMKGAIGSSEIIPDAAFLIPEMTYSMPKSVTAATGMDAFCHAAEAFLSRKRNDFSDLMALEAVSLIANNLRTAQAEPENREAREAMLRASFYAGIAFANSSVTAVHAFAYPLGGMHHVPHGMANSLMFAPIFNHNYTGNEERFDQLAEAFCGQPNGSQFVTMVNQLKAGLGLPMSLKEYGIPESDLEKMAENVMGVTRLLDVNPNQITIDDALRIYREAFNSGE